MENVTIGSFMDQAPPVGSSFGFSWNNGPGGVKGRIFSACIDAKH
jgi:hypothetical protein